jgi:hypothetical protein
VSLPAAPSRAAAWTGYALAGLTTIRWVFCALPSGVPEGGSLRDDAGTPLFREPWALVPVLVLLVMAPAAVALTHARLGRLMILAATDAVVSLYAAAVLTVRPGMLSSLRVEPGAPLALLVALYALGAFSLLETRRLARGEMGPPAFHLGGLRLALCLLVLVLPAGSLLEPGQDRALLLAPFLLVALSAGGARLARSAEGLGLTAALVHLALAGHLVVTLRYTIERASPLITDLRLPGRVTLDLAWIILALAALQAGVHLVLSLRRRSA